MPQLVQQLGLACCPPPPLVPRQLKAMLETVENETLVNKYLGSARRLVVTALMRQLARVYNTVKMVEFLKLIKGLGVSFNDVET